MKKLIIPIVFAIILSSISINRTYAISQNDRQRVNLDTTQYDKDFACNNGGEVVASGSISPTVGKGLRKATQEKLQKIFVAAGKKFNVDPNFLAAFYYAENSRTGDSTNNADSAQPPPTTGDGKWRDPARPYGNGADWPTNQFGTMGAFQFIPSTWATYKVDGNGDGKADAQDLVDGAYGAAKYLAAVGGKVGANENELRAAAYDYNHSQDYVNSIIKAYKYFKTGDQSSVNGSVGDSCAGSNGGIGLTADGFAFPVVATKKDYGSSYPSGLTKPTCKNSGNSSSCHHDYFAADLGPKEGYKVVSAKEGTVRKVNEKPCTGGPGGFPAIHIEGDEGNWFYYAHLKPGSLKVKVGDKVKAGDIIATIGPVQCAENTIPHVHFDVTKKGQDSYFARPGPAANANLIDPMPAINEAYKNLPDR